MIIPRSGLDGRPKSRVIIYVPPGMAGHLVSTVELGKLLVAHGLEVTVALGGGQADADRNGSCLATVEAANPSLSFHTLPHARLPSDDHVAKIFELARASNPALRDFLRSAAPDVLVVDFFCGSALDVGAELGILTYFFLTTCIASVAFSLHHPVLHAQSSLSFRDLGGDPVRAPGLPPIPADHLPASFLDRDSLSYKLFLSLSEQLCRSQGVLVNSCRSLEPRAADAVTLPGRRTPPLYCVGPLVKPVEVGAKRHEWLDGQPKASVVFLCFGSLVRLSAKQTKQVARGLETSGQRFLWNVRGPPGGEHDGDLGALLPDGFLDRTEGRGLVVASWAPQREVLAHGAVGGFVTHCGWNSVLEAVVEGVPMLAWPLYAEQRMNRVLLVEEMRLAVAVEGYEGTVEAEEVAAKAEENHVPALALIIWKGWMILTGNDFLVMTVESGSMEPVYKRGDLVFFHKSNQPIREEDIVLFNVKGLEKPIVHRVIEVIRQGTAEVRFLTKGDNNPVDDRVLYAHNQLWLQEHDIIGQAVGHLQYFGWPFLLLNENPLLKICLLIFALSLMAVTSTESKDIIAALRRALPSVKKKGELFLLEAVHVYSNWKNTRQTCSILVCY